MRPSARRSRRSRRFSRRLRQSGALSTHHRRVHRSIREDSPTNHHCVAQVSAKQVRETKHERTWASASFKQYQYQVLGIAAAQGQFQMAKARLEALQAGRRAAHAAEHSSPPPRRDGPVRRYVDPAARQCLFFEPEPQLFSSQRAQSEVPAADDPVPAEPQGPTQGAQSPCLNALATAS